VRVRIVFLSLSVERIGKRGRLGPVFISCVPSA
jgi:hypothetical protein